MVFLGSRPDPTKLPMLEKETRGFLLLESVSVQSGHKCDSRGQAFIPGWQLNMAVLFPGHWIFRATKLTGVRGSWSLWFQGATEARKCVG